MNARGAAGEPLPQVWKAIETRFLRGQLALVAAGPGTGKSAFVLNYALKAKVPTLYFSADSDAFTQLTRSISTLTGYRMADSARMVLNGDVNEVKDSLSGIPIRFVYAANPTLKTIELHMDSYEEVYGEYPALVVVDNVTNVVLGTAENDEDPFAGLEGLMDYLHEQARETQACIVGLHHVTGGYNDAAKPIPLSGVKGQITRVPEQVLTLHKVPGNDYTPDTIRVSVVKNRGGKADPSGNTFSELEFEGDRMVIRDFSYGNVN